MTGADGIGLFRTEFQFLVSATLPGRDRQLRLYTKVLEAAGERPVVFRTVDIGGDKVLPYLTDEAEEQAENPAMGWRALRLSLDRSTLMKAQARALIEASAGTVLRVMFPMISEPWEYEKARALFEDQVEWARKGHRNSARCSKCRAWPRCSTSCCRASISSRSAPTTSPSSCLPPIAPTRASPSVMIG
jgi:phosphotransferase system enzyme I (PtsP)